MSSFFDTVDLNPKDYDETRMMYSNAQVEEFSLAILPNCNANIRCSEFWIGALNGNANIGCGINILAFMSEINIVNANIGLEQAVSSGQGTEFKYIVDWFNNKIQNVQPTTNKMFIETKRDISTKEALAGFFNLITYLLLPNSCTIIKLNRNENPNLRPHNTTPGHYVLLSKERDETIITYEPIYSSRGTCISRPYKGMVSPGFFRAYSEQGYINASLLAVIDKSTINQIIYGGDKNIINNNIPFIIPETIVEEFTNAINNANECRTQTGGYLKTYKKRNRKKHTRTNIKYTYVRKYKKRLSQKRTR